MNEQCKFCYDVREKDAIKLQRVVYFIKHPHVEYQQFLGKFLNNKLTKQMTIVVGSHLAKVEFESKIGRGVIVESFKEDNTVNLISKQAFNKSNKCLEFRVIEQSNRYLGHMSKEKKSLQKQTLVRKTDGEEFISKQYKLSFDLNNLRRKKESKQSKKLNNNKQIQEFHIIKVKQKASNHETQKMKFIKQVIQLYKKRSRNQKNWSDYATSDDSCDQYEDIYKATNQKFQIQGIQVEEIQNDKKFNEEETEQISKQIAREYIYSSMEMELGSEQVHVNQQGLIDFEAYFEGKNQMIFTKNFK